MENIIKYIYLNTIFVLLWYLDIKGSVFMKYKKKTNGFETSIFGIDLFIKWVISRTKEKRKIQKLNKSVDKIF